MGVYLDRRSGRWGVDLRLPPTRDGKRVRFLVGTKAEAQTVLAQKTVEARQARFAILRPPPAPAWRSGSSMSMHLNAVTCGPSRPRCGS